MSPPAKVLTSGLLILIGLCLGALIFFGDSAAQASSAALAPRPDHAQGTPAALATNYEFLGGDQFTTNDCAATLRVYVGYLPTAYPSWYDPAGQATEQFMSSAACSNVTRTVNWSANGGVLSIDYPFYIRNQNRAPGRYRVTFLDFTAYFNISQAPTPTPTATPAYTDSVSGKVVDNRGKPLAGAPVAARAPAWVKRSFGGTGNLAGVDCPTATSCFLVGQGGIIKTSSDGGATWAWGPWVTSADLWDVNCPTATTCFALGENSTLLATTDGAAWNHQTTNTDGLQSISCPTASACFAVGYDLLATTTNGGTTWASSSRFADAYNISCPTSMACFVAGWGSQIAATTDGGTTWGSQSTGAEVDYFAAVSCPTATTCFAVGRKSGESVPVVAITTNGGAAWRSQMLPFSTTTPIGGLSCPTATTCSVIGRYGLTSTTSDGGATWQIGPTFETSSHAIKALSCPTATACLAVGEYGTLGTYLPVKLYEATTDAAGNYTLMRLAPNTYTLAVTQGGHTFTPVTRSIIVPPSATGQDFVGDFAQPTLYLPVILTANMPGTAR